MEIKALYTELSSRWESAYPTPSDPHQLNQMAVIQMMAQATLEENRQKTIDELLQKYPLDELICISGEMYFNPRAWQYYDQLMPNMLWVFHHKFSWILSVLENLLLQHQPDNIHSQIETFLRDHTESADPYYMFPKPYDAPVILTLFKPTPDLICLAKRILAGEFQLSTMTRKPMFSPQVVYYHHEIAAPLAHLTNYLSTQGALDYPSFRQYAINYPQILAEVPALQMRGHIVKTSKNLLEEAEKYHLQLIDDLAAQLTNENYRPLLMTRLHLRGFQYLLHAAEAHSRLKLDKLTAPATWFWNDNVEQAVVRLAINPIGEPANNDEAQLQQLHAFPAKTLQRLLPVAGYSRHIICQALGWDAAVNLVELIVSFAGLKSELGTIRLSNSTDIPNSSDTYSGAVDIKAVESAVNEAGEDLAKTIIKLFREAKVGVTNTLTMIEAVMGWNRKKVEEGLLKHNQISIKAYGALPLENDNQILERYRVLKKAGKDGQKFGQMRRANQAAAAQVGLINLAQRAGYSELERFEWAMESKIAENSSTPDRTWTIGDYQLQLVVEGIDAKLLITRQGKTLKSVPKEVRGHLDYDEAKEALAQFRAQTRRLRTELLEAALANGNHFSPEELDYLLKFPAAHSMLERLILRTPDGCLGLCLPDQHAIRDLNGSIHRLDQGFQVAHPYHLYQAGELAAWQKFLVRERIVQPFKQGFRELYLLTPAERSTGTYSNRFANHSVTSTQAAKLLTSRGWKIERGNVPVPYKVFGNMRVEWNFLDIQHFFGGGQPARSDSIHFEPHPVIYQMGMERGENWFKLSEIDSLIFSEVMRDADLVVSVAQRDGDAGMSNERYQQRGDLVLALLDDLGLPGVRVDGHHAHIEGKLAKYRVHLGSAVIHIEPGNYLCIVPDRWGKKHDNLFLPFADEGDSKISEVISKILLLLADDKIKDESILRQIRR